MREPRRNASKIGICSTGQGTLPSLEDEEEEESFLTPDFAPCLFALHWFSLLLPLLKLNLTWCTEGDLGVEGPLRGDEGYECCWADCPDDWGWYEELLAEGEFGTGNDEWLWLLDGLWFRLEFRYLICSAFRLWLRAEAGGGAGGGRRSTLLAGLAGTAKFHWVAAPRFLGLGGRNCCPDDCPEWWWWWWWWLLGGGGCDTCTRFGRWWLLLL